MRIRLSDLETQRIEVELPAGDALRLIRLENLAGLTGEVTRGPNGFSLRPLEAREAQVAQIAWPLAAGELSLDNPATISRLSFEAEVGTDGSGFRGRAQAQSVVARAVRLALGATRIACDTRARELIVEQSEVAGSVAGEALELGELQAALGGLLIRWSRATLGRLRYDWDSSSRRFAAATGSLTSAVLTASGIELTAGGVELPAGLQTSGRTVVAPEVVIPELVIAIDDVMTLFGAAPAPSPAASGSMRAATEPPTPGASGSMRAATEPPVRARTATDPGPRRLAFDLGFLDRVGGRAEVDLTLDLSLPVIGTRRKTHHFRVPIADGTFNYKELERDLADLEDAFIDVELRGQRLVIERRIPLIPGLERPLLLFDLDEREVELAKRRLARLATIGTIRRPPPQGDGKSVVVIKRLELDDIDVALTLAPPAEGTRDAAWGAHAGKISATGALHFAPGKALGPTQGTLAADAVGTGPGGFGIGGIELSFQSLGAARIEIQVGFEGFRPRAAQITVRELRLTNVKFSPRATPAAPAVPADSPPA